MKKNPQQRPKSSARGKTPQALLSLDQVLKQINPQNKPAIELEDMKRLLHRVPESSRPLVQQIFHSFIFNTKSFVLPVAEFCRLFGQLQGPRAKNYEESNFRGNANITRDYIRTGQVSKDISYCADNRSHSPEHKVRTSTYAQLYKDKKSAPAKKSESSAGSKANQNVTRTERTERAEKSVKDKELNGNYDKRLLQYYDTKETNDMSPVQKSIEVFNTNRSFKDCYSNLQELIDIRKAHLKQTALGNR